MDKNKEKVTETVSYNKENIQAVFNILDSVPFTGVTQIRAIAQISVILDNPVPVDGNDKNKSKEDIEK